MNRGADRRPLNGRRRAAGIDFTAQAARRLVPILFERIAEHASLPQEMT